MTYGVPAGAKSPTWWSAYLAAASGAIVAAQGHQPGKAIEIARTFADDTEAMLEAEAKKKKGPGEVVSVGDARAEARDWQANWHAETAGRLGWDMDTYRRRVRAVNRQIVGTSESVAEAVAVWWKGLTDEQRAAIDERTVTR